MLIFMITNGKAEELWRLIPAYLIVGINVAILSVMTSALSIIIPRFAVGAVTVTVALVGLFHSLLSLLKDIIGGFGGEMIKYALKIIPDLDGIQSQAENILLGNSVDIHIILTGLLAVYVYVVLILVLKRKEA